MSFVGFRIGLGFGPKSQAESQVADQPADGVELRRDRHAGIASSHFLAAVPHLCPQHDAIRALQNEQCVERSTEHLRRNSLLDFGQLRAPPQRSMEACRRPRGSDVGRKHESMRPELTSAELSKHDCELSWQGCVPRISRLRRRHYASVDAPSDADLLVLEVEIAPLKGKEFPGSHPGNREGQDLRVAARNNLFRRCEQRSEVVRG